MALWKQVDIMSGKRITVVGTGYVGMSFAVLLAKHNEVTALDIDAARVDLINQSKPTVVDAETSAVSEDDLSLVATLDKAVAYEDAEFVVIATPTDYNPETNCLILTWLRLLLVTLSFSMKRRRLLSSRPCLWVSRAILKISLKLSALSLA